VPGQNAEREHLVEHGDPAGTGEIRAPGMMMRPGPGPDTDTGSAGARYSSRCAGPGCSRGTASARRLRLHPRVRDRPALGMPGCSGSTAARPRSWSSWDAAWA
jgi:hypothetical protein